MLWVVSPKRTVRGGLVGVRERRDHTRYDVRVAERQRGGTRSRVPPKPRATTREPGESGESGESGTLVVTAWKDAIRTFSVRMASFQAFLPPVQAELMPGICPLRKASTNNRWSSRVRSA
ncbi:hypothetical protein [Actinophytocola sp.]|uniref:hypothetical protein n=1 Tax=Actinophytocola sp. TaxID=1872138 RepID=UPI003D6BC65E